jgi:hypothetical protein
MPATIHLDDVPPEQRKAMGLRTPDKSKFNAEETRNWALKVLAVAANLSRQERGRVPDAGFGCSCLARHMV